jgi:hypothetical protein
LNDVIKLLFAQTTVDMSNTYSQSSMIRPPREAPNDRPRFPDYGIERTTETAGDFSTLGSFQQHQQQQQQQQTMQQQSQDRSAVGAKTFDNAAGLAPPQPPYAPTTTKNGGGGVPTSGDHVPHWRLLVEHWHATVAYCAVFWSFGMCVAFLGPTLLDLGCQVSADMRAVSWVFVAQLFCSLAGATVAGYLARR